MVVHLAASVVPFTVLLVCSPAFGDVLLMTANPDHGIYRAEPDGTGSYIGTTFATTPIPSSGYPFAMAFDDRSGFLYWTDRNKLEISRARLDGSDYKAIVSEDSITLRGIAVDPVNDRVLWCDPGKQQIEFVDLDGSNRGILINSGITYPNDIIVAKIKGFIFWCDYTLAKIERVNINGTGRIIVVSEIEDLTSLTLDYNEQRLYWSDRALDRIESVNLDGSDRHVHVTKAEGQSSYDPYVIALRGVENDIYFTDYSHKMLYWLRGSDDGTVSQQVVSSSTLLPDAPRWLLFIQDPTSTTQSATTEPSSMDPSSPFMNSKLFVTRGLPNTNSCMRDHVIHTTRATTKTQCAMMCSLNHDCLSFNYFHRDSLCELNKGRQEDVPRSAFDMPESDCSYFELKK